MILGKKLEETVVFTDTLQEQTKAAFLYARGGSASRQPARSIRDSSSRTAFIAGSSALLTWSWSKSQLSTRPPVAGFTASLYW